MTRQRKSTKSIRACGIGTRRPRLETLENRLVYSADLSSELGLDRIPSFYPNTEANFAPRDDAFVVSVNDRTQSLDILSNDGHYIFPVFRDDAALPPVTRLGLSIEDVATDDQSDGTMPVVTRQKAIETLKVNQPENGSLTVSDDGIVKYKPNEGFAGIDKFTYEYKVGDEVKTANVYINVIEPLFAMQDWFRVDEGSQNNILDVLRNDTFNSQHLVGRDFNKDFKIVSVDADDVSGTVEIDAEKKKLIYTPQASAEGLQTFTYVIEDQFGYRSTATAKVQVSTINASNESQMWDEQIEQRLLEMAMNSVGWNLGSPTGDNYHYLYPVFDFAIADGVPGVERTQLLSLAAPSGNSTTNNQESGVDEGDIVKSDGNYIYLISNWKDASSKLHYQLVISDVRSPSQPSVVSRYSLDNKIQSMNLNGDRISLISHGDGKVTMTVLDVSDRTSPEFLYEASINGSLDQTRMIGDVLYVVSQDTGYTAPEIQTLCYQEDVGCFYETARQYVGRITENSLRPAAPSVRTKTADGTIGSKDSNVNTLPSESSNHWNSYTATITSLDLTGDSLGVVDVESFSLEYGTSVYVSQGSMYLMSTGNSFNRWLPVRGLLAVEDNGTVVGDDDEEQYWGPTTEIEKISLSDSGEMTWAASGEVRGFLLNSFSADEHEGHLRVATNDFNTSAVYVLAQEDRELNVVGSVRDLAEGEAIYSVRFEGDRGYVVTFRQVDPLFVFDLSDPANPKLTGELKISGYSNYLHIIDENHVLGIGREADETGLYQEMQMTLFDISDVEKPVAKDRYSFEGGRNLWSPLLSGARNLGSHHSVNYFASHQTLVVPVYESEFGSPWSPWFGLDDNPGHEISMRVFDVDLEDGISELGKVEFDNLFDPNLARSVRIGDVMYSVSPYQVIATELRDPSELVSQWQIASGAVRDKFKTRAGRDIVLDVLENDGFVDSEDGEVKLIVSGNADGGTVVVTPDQKVSFVPRPGFRGETEFTYTVEIDGVMATSTVQVDVKQSRHRIEKPIDVNGDGDVTTLDALNVINMMRKHGSVSVDEFEEKATEQEDYAIDVNDDGTVSALDALLVINHIAKLRRAELAAQAAESRVAAGDTVSSNVDTTAGRASGESQVALSAPAPKLSSFGLNDRSTNAISTPTSPSDIDAAMADQEENWSLTSAF